MSLKVIVPNGRTEITVNGLHQWDYGRTIEIHAAGLPADVEVHFACSGMDTAVVRNCAVLDGKVTAAVPDICLEQTTHIVAWVHAKGATTGATILTITLPIIPRTQPQQAATVPETVSNAYTEAVEAMNKLVAECEETVENAATEVEKRIAANLYNEGWVAKKAESANQADTANKALYDNSGRTLDNSLICTRDGFTKYAGVYIGGGVLSCRIGDSTDARIIAEVSGQKCHSGVVMVTYSGNEITARLGFEKQEGSELYKITFQEYSTDLKAWLQRNAESAGISVYFKHLVTYPWR